DLHVFDGGHLTLQAVLCTKAISLFQRKRFHRVSLMIPTTLSSRATGSAKSPESANRVAGPFGVLFLGPPGGLRAGSSCMNDVITTGMVAERKRKDKAHLERLIWCKPGRTQILRPDTC